MILAQINNLVRPTLRMKFLPCHRRLSDRPFLYQSLELILITIAVILLVNITNHRLAGRAGWLAVPCILATAALVPTFIRKKKLSQIGLNLSQTGRALRLVGIACLATLPITFFGLYLLRRFGLTAPLAPQAPPHAWIYWLLYQIMYVAAAEELFFRGYLQSSLLRLASAAGSKYTRIGPMATVIISAVVFALAHVILANNILSAFTFFPGVILGWLFLRTRSLVAPILFHALANISYALMINMLA